MLDKVETDYRNKINVPFTWRRLFLEILLIGETNCGVDTATDYLDISLQASLCLWFLPSFSSWNCSSLTFTCFQEKAQYRSTNMCLSE